MWEVSSGTALAERAPDVIEFGADGARVRDALHTVMMDSGGAAYIRLVWQLGFTIVEVLAIAPAASLLCSTCFHRPGVPTRPLKSAHC